MEVDAVLIIGGLVGQVIGKTPDRGKFVTRLWVEISVTGTGVDRAVTDADIRQAGGVIGTNRYIAGNIGHEVVDARVPAQREFGYRSPKAVVESLMLSDRMNATPGGVSVPVTVPFKEVLVLPVTVIKLTAAWPPKTGVANT